MNNILINRIEPTVFWRHGSDGLEQLVKVILQNSIGDRAGILKVVGEQKVSESLLEHIPSGESTHDIFIKESMISDELEFVLSSQESVFDQKKIGWIPPRHWVVHVVQNSHHDVGYTNLPSKVIREHEQWLDQAIDCAAGTREFPEEAQFRIVVEQAWSIDRFLRDASSARAAEMIKLLHSGHIEVTALFGNLTTELCGHEELNRSVYHAFRLKKKYGIPIISAEHNDITGFSWGLSSVLINAGIKLFCPGLPLYYQWSDLKLQSFWDEKAIFGYKGPGAFWWEAPDGQRILFWCNNSGCGGDPRPGLPRLAKQLQLFQEQGYPYSIVRWPVIGGGRDNSPYIDGYARTIKDWNSKWAFPKLISSTNARFYQDFITVMPKQLPVWQGELPGQDYPVGASSTANATAVNRQNHGALPAAETLATVASSVTDLSYPAKDIDEAYEDVLWHDEHTWGYSFPCGPASQASESEKAVHAYRASALTHDITAKAMARIADYIQRAGEELLLVVFNPHSYQESNIVRVPMTEIPNCGSTMSWYPPEKDDIGEGYIYGVLLTDRSHVRLSSEIIEGKFDLLDPTNDEKVPFQIVEMRSPDEPLLFAPQRFGSGAMKTRLNTNEPDDPAIRRDITFKAVNVPACGYKTYRLVPRKSRPVFRDPFQITEAEIENPFYRIGFDEKGWIKSIVDKETDLELLDAQSPFAFGDIVVRDPDVRETWSWDKTSVVQGIRGPVCMSVERTGSAKGCPCVRQALTLYADVKRLDFSVRILKDVTPLQDIHLAFPFSVDSPRFRYEGVLSVMEPIKDYLPGAYSDAISVQNWVKVADSDERHNVLWASLDAPVAGFGGLWPGYVSQAHRCVLSEHMPHPPLKEKDLKKGWIFSLLFNNNFKTNFSVSQSGDFLFRYAISSHAGKVSDTEAGRFGRNAMTQFGTIFSKTVKRPVLPMWDSFIEIDRPEVVLLALKRAADGNGVILRLWNIASHEVQTVVKVSFLKLAQVYQTNGTEEKVNQVTAHDQHGISLIMKAQAVTTLNLI